MYQTQTTLTVSTTNLPALAAMIESMRQACIDLITERGDVLEHIAIAETRGIDPAPCLLADLDVLNVKIAALETA